MSAAKKIIDKGRRGFLSLIPLAPVAATVAAKDAAAAMGLSGPLKAVGYGIGGMPTMAGFSQNPVPDGRMPWFIDSLKNFMSPDTIEGHRTSAKGMARILDPDIAAMR